MPTTRRAESVFLIRKPRGAIAKYWDEQFGRIKGRPRPAIEQRLLTYIAEHADLLEVPAPRSAPSNVPDGWLLVPAPKWLIDDLAVVNAEREDHEPDPDLEATGDFEEEEREDEGESELTIVRAESMDRVGLPDSDDIATAEQRARYRVRPYDNRDIQAKRVRAFIARR